MSNTPNKWKHVWITGASSGLGEYTARILAEKGCHVSISARSLDKLEAIAATHENISAHAADVTDGDRLKEVVSEIEAAHGPIDLCILSAGAWFQSSITELNIENFQKTSYGATKAALIHMAETVKPELEAKNIVVSVVNPGFVRTAMTDKNKFPMPFLMEPEDAAEKIISGLEAEKFEVAFPWQLVWILKFLNHLPYWLYFKIIKRLV